MIERKGGLKGLTGDGGEVWNTAYALEQYKQTVADLATELNKTKKKIEVLQQILVDESRERANFERQIAEGALVPVDVGQAFHDNLIGSATGKTLQQFAAEKAKESK
jgi:hypothetical protein